MAPNYIFFILFQAEDSVDDDVLNSFCWMYSSFDMPPNFSGACTRKKYIGSHLYNTYYQWVPIFLAIQAGLFYIPRCLWLMLEGGLMSYIVKGKILNPEQGICQLSKSGEARLQIMLKMGGKNKNSWQV